MTALDEPRTRDDLRALLLDYLDHYRGQVTGKVATMDEQDVYSSILPSGWTPAQLLNHLAFMERRWFVCTFEGRRVDDPRGDWQGDHWAPVEASVAELTQALTAAGRVTRQVVEAHQLDELAASPGSYSDQEPPHLQWILLHVLQEYARHAGQLDIVAELTGADGDRSEGAARA